MRAVPLKINIMLLTTLLFTPIQFDSISEQMSRGTQRVMFVVNKQSPFALQLYPVIVCQVWWTELGWQLPGR